MEQSVFIECGTPVFRKEFVDSRGRVLTRIEERPLVALSCYVRTLAPEAECLDELSFAVTRDLFVYARSLDEALQALCEQFLAREKESSTQGAHDLGEAA